MRANRNRLLFLLCAVLAATVVHAREISVQEAVAKAQQEVDGKVLSVQALNVGKRKVYRIKILTRDGQVRIVQVQAEQ
ncbi:PepSY domain-containing protein [Dokdonella fugitiva]|nr:PepSY domain-containing protein [Dokdonella fugitiva]MBA8885122.1 putative membrane protein YkoI [Dokdonella fugitiva]